MRAIVCHEFGPVSTLRLEQLEAPSPGPGQVAIRVHACGINFPDILIVEGRYQARPPLPFCPGGEVAGEIVGLGSGVEGLALGQRVMAVLFWGGMAEQVLAPARAVTVLPEGMDYRSASVFQGGHVTVTHALRQRGQLRAGETLLVLGAAGGVGLAAVQIGKAMGARVIAAVGSAAKGECARLNGADEVIDYASTSLKDEVKRLTEGRGADVVLDPVGGEAFDQATRCIAWNGRLLVVGFASGRIPEFPVNLALLKGYSVVGVNYQGFERSEPEGVAENYRILLDWYARGLVHAHIDRVFPLEEAPEALRYVGERKAIGKVVVSLVDDAD